MSTLKRKVKSALDEGRMLILGSTVLLGFDYRSAFESGFDHLPVSSQYLKMTSLGLMVLATALLMSPASHHRIVDRGHDTPALHDFSTRVMAMALLPFALALGIDVGVVAARLVGFRTGVGIGVAVATTGLLCWYGLEAFARRRRRRPRREPRPPEDDAGAETPLADRIDHVLTEARMVLPGVQALLGFQLAAMLTDGFEKLPATSQRIHLAGLGLIALSMVLVMTPAAYHRMVEHGEDTPDFHRLASAFLAAAMVPLALGIAADFFVVVAKITARTPVAVAAAVATLLVFYGLWFGLTAYRRSRKGTQRRPGGRGAAQRAA